MTLSVIVVPVVMKKPKNAILSSANVVLVIIRAHLEKTDNLRFLK